MIIEVGEGKYSFVMNANGTIERILRYGEEWSPADELRYSGVILALIQDLIAAKDWISVKDQKPDYKEPIVYAKPKSPGKWSVGIAYRTVSQKWNPQMESEMCPEGFTHWKSLGEPPKE